MPLQVTADAGERVVKIRGWGEITDNDLEAAREQFRTDPEVDPTFSRLCDLREVTSGTFSGQALEDWAADPISNPPVRHAVICTNPRAIHLATDFARRSRRYHREVSVFPTEEHARAWLSEGPEPALCGEEFGS